MNDEPPQNPYKAPARDLAPVAAAGPVMVDGLDPSVVVGAARWMRIVGLCAVLVGAAVALFLLAGLVWPIDQRTPLLEMGWRLVPVILLILLAAHGAVAGVLLVQAGGAFRKVRTVAALEQPLALQRGFSRLRLCFLLISILILAMIGAAVVLFVIWSLQTLRIVR